MGTKRLYVQNVDEWKKFFLCKGFFERKLEVKIIERGIILPARRLEANSGFAGGVCDNDFNFVAGYTRKESPEKLLAADKLRWVGSSYKVDRNELVQLDEDVIFGGVLMGHFGHFMIECWNRLWYVIQNPELKLKVLFITIIPAGNPRHFFNDFFRLMGIETERIIYVKQPMQCRSVAVPDQSQYVLRFTKEFMAPYQAISSRVKSQKSNNAVGGGQNILYADKFRHEQKFWANTLFQ